MAAIKYRSLGAVSKALLAGTLPSHTRIIVGPNSTRVVSGKKGETTLFAEDSPREKALSKLSAGLGISIEIEDGLRKPVKGKDEEE